MKRKQAGTPPLDGAWLELNSLTPTLSHMAMQLTTMQNQFMVMMMVMVMVMVVMMMLVVMV